MTKSFTSVLVANRGEIALRIMKTARAEGLECIAIYTDADLNAPHVAYADRAIRIGSGPVGDSYLSIDKVLNAAKTSNAEAIHPGYGFLSENAEFASACEAEGIVFVGPSAAAIALMGNKAAAKRKMIAAGVPCVPGYEGEDQTAKHLADRAIEIGYPVMIKAAAGGGGRGMRLVESPSHFDQALTTAKSESFNAFGSDEVILEKAVLRPRHVEIQVFADRHDTVVHLGERDCSVQRRHQKVVEEAPCPVMTDDLRDAMGQAAVEAARSIGYEGAGTVEFLLDDSGSFYFLEMNTRLQVEHPVTELITGRDLVALQFAVARGEPLGFAQDDVKLTGHAIEVRLYAEDPTDDFLPSSGKIYRWEPGQGPGIRVDAGINVGQEISQFYDPMLAKIVAHGDTRSMARDRLVKALRDTATLGPLTNRDFLISVLEKEKFCKGQATTAFIAEEFGENIGAKANLSFQEIVTAAALYYQSECASAQSRAVIMPDELLGWGSPGALQSRLTLQATGDQTELTLTTDGSGNLKITSGGSTAVVSFDPLRIDGQHADLRAFEVVNDKIYVATGKATFNVEIVRAAKSLEKKSGGVVRAPMHGLVTRVLVKTGDTVEVGTPLLVLEAMKMQHELLAEVAGTVSFAATPGQVQVGSLLVEIEENSE